MGSLGNQTRLRPRGCMFNSSLRRRAIGSPRPSSASGLLRCADKRTDANSASLSGVLTRSTQTGNRDIGIRSNASKSASLYKIVARGFPRLRACYRPPTSSAWVGLGVLGLRDRRSASSGISPHPIRMPSGQQYRSPLWRDQGTSRALCLVRRQQRYPICTSRGEHATERFWSFRYARKYLRVESSGVLLVPFVAQCTERLIRKFYSAKRSKSFAPRRLVRQSGAECPLVESERRPARRSSQRRRVACFENLPLNSFTSLPLYLYPFILSSPRSGARKILEQCA